jgi:adenylate kinase family enzyme
MRISIIGHAGSGKSTLARRISNTFHIPHLHLDRLWFEAGGSKARVGESLEKVRSSMREQVVSFIRQKKWVSDGWYARVQSLIVDRADQIVFLDISLARRLMNHLWRTFFDRRHAEVSMWDDLRFFYQIIRRTYVHGPGLRAFVRDHADKTVVLRSYGEVERYFANLS